LFGLISIFINKKIEIKINGMFMISRQNEEHLHDQRFSLQDEEQGKEDYTVGTSSIISHTKDYYDATCCHRASLLRLATLLSVVNYV